MSSVILATGYRAQIGYISETTYGVAPTSSTYKWLGAVQSLSVNINRNPYIIYRLDGVSRFPGYILPGQREVEVDLVVNPQDINLLADVINNPVSTPESFIVQWNDVNQAVVIYGNRANTVKFVGKTGNAFEVDYTFWAQNLSTSLPSNVAFPTDPGSTPFYWTLGSVTVSGSTDLNVIGWDCTITQNLQRVFIFGQDFIRVLPPLNAQVEGTVTVTFQDLSEVTRVLNFSNVPLTFTLGPDSTQTTRSLQVSNAKFSQFQIPAKPSDLVSFDIPFVGNGAWVG